MPGTRGNAFRLWRFALLAVMIPLAPSLLSQRRRISKLHNFQADLFIAPINPLKISTEYLITAQGFLVSL